MKRKQVGLFSPEFLDDVMIPQYYEILIIKSTSSLSSLFPLLSRNVSNCVLFNLQIVDYLEKEWSCKHEIQLNAPDFAVWTFDSYDSIQKVSLDLGVNTLTKKGSIVMSLYCPFWMLNKTGVMLTYRVSWHMCIFLNYSHSLHITSEIFFRLSADNHLLITTAVVC